MTEYCDLGRFSRPVSADSSDAQSLHGLHEYLVRRGEVAESCVIGERLDFVLARADIGIRSSRYCRMETAA